MTALAKIMIKGQTIRKHTMAASTSSGSRVLRLMFMVSSAYLQRLFSLAAESEEIAIMASQSQAIWGMSSRLVRFSHFTSLRPGRRYAAATNC